MEESAGTRDATIGALFTELDGPGLDRRVKSGSRDSSRRTFSAAAMAFAQSELSPLAIFFEVRLRARLLYLYVHNLDLSRHCAVDPTL